MYSINKLSILNPHQIGNMKTVKRSYMSEHILGFLKYALS